MKESEFERRFLDFVYRTELAITPGALAYYADIPIAEATSHLERLVTREIVKMDIAANGDLVYSFPNRQRVAQEIENPVQLVRVAGAGAVVPVRPAPLVAPAVRTDTTACPYCGENILAVAKKCKHCGEMLEPGL